MRSWLRAKFLYALLPADTTVFRIVRDPGMLLMRLVKLSSFLGVNVIMFILTFGALLELGAWTRAPTGRPVCHATAALTRF